MVRGQGTNVVLLIRCGHNVIASVSESTHVLCYCLTKLDNHPLDGDVQSKESNEDVVSKYDDLESEGSNKTTQKIVSILADFLDGEVRSFHTFCMICVKMLYCAHL